MNTGAIFAGILVGLLLIMSLTILWMKGIDLKNNKKDF